MADVIAIVDYEEATLDDLHDAANAGDKEALCVFLDRLKGDQDKLIKIAWGNLPKLLEKMVLGSYLPKNPVNREAVKARMAKMRRDLAGPDPTPLETLLVERVALTWMDLHLAELIRDVHHPSGDMKKSVKVFEARDRWYQRAHDRYLKALKTLAQIRKLKLPNVILATSADCWPVGHQLGRPADKVIEAKSAGNSDAF